MNGYKIRMRVEFSRNDSQPGGELIRAVFCDEFVQITYNQVRIGPEGDLIGFYNEKAGYWELLPNYASGEPGEWYSDVTVSLEEISR